MTAGVLPIICLIPKASSSPNGGLLGQYWANTFFGTAFSSSCISIPMPATPSPSNPSNGTQIDPVINFASMTNYLWHPDLVKPNFSQFSVRWTGNITIASASMYGFQLSSDDGSWLFIDSSLVINRGGLNGKGNSTMFLTLTQGVHQIEVDYYETCGSESGIDFSWEPPGTSSFVFVPQSVLGASPSFSISASSPSAIWVGQPASSSVNVASINGFSGNVSFSDSVPTSLTCGSIMPKSVIGSGAATVSCSSGSVGTFSLTIAGKSGILGSSTTATFVFIDFAVSASPVMLSNVPPGCDGVSLITVTSSGFAGNVLLSASGPPVVSPDLDKRSLQSGITALSVTNTGSATVIIAVAGQFGATTGTTYQVSVNGVGLIGGIAMSHQTMLQISFGSAPNSASYVLCPGGTGPSSSNVSARPD